MSSLQDIFKQYMTYRVSCDMTTPDVPGIRYRAECNVYGGHDGEPLSASIEIDTYRVIKPTPRGAWIRPEFAGNWTNRYDRFVLDGSRKKYAYPTKAEAMESLWRRKLRQVSILSDQLRRAKAALQAVEILRREVDDDQRLGRSRATLHEGRVPLQPDGGDCGLDREGGD